MTPLSIDKRIPLLVLAVGLATTYLLQQAAFKDARHTQESVFAYQAHEIMLRIEQRLIAYEQILCGAKGLFAASKHVDRGEFHDYMVNQRLTDHYPGIQGVGFSQIISPQEKARNIEPIRRKGFPSYTVWPEGERNLYTSIIYLEPFSSRNLRAFGYDMYSETLRRATMEQARDLDKPVMSGKVRLMQETDVDVQAGFLMYLPVYRNGSPHETLADRRANIIGWVYAPFRMDDLMHGILGEQANNVGLEIYDGKNAAPEFLMYDSNSDHDQYAPLYHSTQSIEIAGHEWAVVLHSLPVFEAAIDTGRVTVIRLTGALVSVLLSLLVWQLASGREQALDLAQDMTQGLRESEEKFRAIIEAIPVPLALNDERGNITYLNRAFVQTIGYTTDDIPVLADWWPRAYPDPKYRQWVIERWRNNLEEAKRSHEPFRPLELGIKCKDGAVRTFMAGAASLKEDFAGIHLVILYDITTRKKAEEALLRSEAMLHTLYNSTSDAVMLLDEKGFFDCNKATLAMFGCATKEEFCSKHLADLSPPEQPGDTNSMTLTDRLIDAAMKKESNVFEWLFQRVDTGKIFPADVLLNSMTLDGKTVLQATVRDITERKEYEEELKCSNAELEQFSYAVSHDMRQPLRMISSYLQLIEMSLGGQLDEEKRGYFNFAIEGAKRIDQMLVALLEYSRVGRMGDLPDCIESRAVLDEALQYLQPAIAEARAKLDISGEWPRICASRDEILRLLQNLIGNAAKFRVAGRTPEIGIGSEITKNEWHLCVADNGAGIIPDQIGRLFQVFQRLQLRTAYEGNGVGLALCRKIAEHHKGRIWAESEGEGKGSRFYVALPVLMKDTISATGKPA